MPSPLILIYGCSILLLHAAQSFPTYIPFSVFRESWVSYIVASVPTGAHHCDRVKETSVAGQVKTQAFGFLEIVSADEIGVFAFVNQQRFKSGFWFAKTAAAIAIMP